MSDKSFFDTNVIIYLYSEDEKGKKSKSTNLVENHDAIISIQVINELSNVLSKKFKIKYAQISTIIKEISENFSVIGVSVSNVLNAHKIADRYGYSYYDSLIISSAIENECNVLYTEDMQDGQNIENLTIVNPFK